MMRVGVISNPRSRRNRDGMDKIRAVLARHGDIAHAELSRMAELPAAVRRFADSGVSLVVVNGGDGTVHAVLSEILNGVLLADPPRLAALPSGMTNLIAVDVGLAGRPDLSLANLLSRVRDGGELTVRRRPVLSLTPAPGARASHGMFFGTGAFYRAVMASRRRIHPTGVRHDLATALSVGLFIAGMLLRRSSPGSPYRGDGMTIRRDGGVARTGTHLGMVATTLERLSMGLDPFWDGTEGPMRYTLLPFPPHRFGSAMVPILLGRPLPWMAGKGYESGRAAELAFTIDCPLVLDGEVYAAPTGAPAVLRADREVEFVTIDG